MTRPHGTRRRYIAGPDENGQEGAGCRCTACRRANADRAAAAYRRMLERRWNGTPAWADAEPARQHVKTLMAKGAGIETIAAAGRVSTNTIYRLLYPLKGNPPARRMRADTADRILAVRLENTLQPGHQIDVTGTRRRIHALAAIGWSLAEQGRRLGITRNNMSTITHQKLVTVRVARKIAALYDELSMTPATGRTADRTRAIAARKGWAPPLAWDDDTIDDPAAAPDWGATAPRSDAIAEDAEFLMRVDGLTPELVAARLGVSLRTVERYARKTRHQQRKEAAA